MSECPVVDKRYVYGDSPAPIRLPHCPSHMIGESMPFGTKVQFTNIENGYAHDRELALRYLFPGNIYKTERVVVNQSSSSVELEDFPGVWFNTVLFTEKESA